ncbi:SelT/SelW/SelH family protein [Sporobolomyces salmoneus]|uniref:SelT/SelW/SelH family protein n=1 Tax=Sporobolomyces salmoneus TaxID=183962 RepID=UPI00317B5C2E
MSTSIPCEDCQPPSTAPETAPPAPAATQDPLLDPSTFIPPLLSDSSPDSETPRVVIEFCDRCRWLHRATWTQTELFLTFPPPIPPLSSAEGTEPTPAATATSGGLKAITLIPRNSPETGGRFRVWLLRPRTPTPTATATGSLEEGKDDEKEKNWRGWELVWDRKIEGGFPEMKVLKQRIRNLIAPKQDLGHSDKPGKTQ